jgi:hypothetical protein
MRRTVLFVCQHGAGRSRLAAAWFNHAAPNGWWATTAGVAPQQQVSAHAPRLLAGTAAEPALDHAPPRPLSAVAGPDLVITIDCAVPGATRWDLLASDFDDAMCTELRDRVDALVQTLPDSSTTEAS